jgi:hypothetical protein
MVIARLLLIVTVLALACSASAQEPFAHSRGQTVYVPVYSEILHGDLDRQGKPGKYCVNS